MNPVFCVAADCTTPLGLDLTSAWSRMHNKERSIVKVQDACLASQDIWVSRFTEEQWLVMRDFVRDDSLTAFETLAVYSVKKVLQHTNVDPARTQFILSTTKGNIEHLTVATDDRNRLRTSAALIGQALGLCRPPIVVSHACVSGVSSLIYGMRLLQAGVVDHVVVCGVDRLTRFVISGFASFLALADEPCRPFDQNRKGINLGEAAATIILTTKPNGASLARVMGGATSNDANHISGPSRTGQELANAITRAIEEARISPMDIATISAHGTATLYNDEMEAKAFALANLLHSPVHSAKSYFGHTLGAAGVLETVLLVESMRQATSIGTLGFESLGVPHPIKVSEEGFSTDIRYALKTASGFGGCNAALVLGK